MYLAQTPSRTSARILQAQIATGGYAVVSITVANSGQQAGNFTISGDVQLPDGTVEGHLFTGTPGNLGSETYSGSVAAGSSVTATMNTNTLADASAIAGYDPTQGLTVVVYVTDADTGAQVSTAVPGAIFLPSAASSSGSGSSGSGSGSSGTSAACTQLLAQAQTIQGQMNQISLQIQAQEQVDNANGVDVTTDPVIQSLSAQWSTLASQYNAVEAQISANGCV